MKIKEKIMLFLNNKEGLCCDDCISNHCDIHPRQSVNQVCNELYAKGIILRERDDCILCGKTKLCNSYVNNNIETASHSNTLNHTGTITLTTARQKYKSNVGFEDSFMYSILKEEYYAK